MVIDLREQIPVCTRTGGEPRNGRCPRAGASFSRQTGRDHRQAAASPGQHDAQARHTGISVNRGY